MDSSVRNEPEPLPDRRHPYRLDREAYQTPGWIVFATFRSRSRSDLAEATTAGKLLAVTGRMARLHGICIHAYCIMPDHAHVVVSVAEQGGDFEKWLRYVKRESGKALGVAKLWQRSYWDRHARADEDVIGMVEYTLANPARKGLCASWDQWPHSWSQWHPETRGADPNQ